jgi:hypothetical protein
MLLARILAAATPEAERSAFATGQEARAGREFISPQPPFLPAPPERSVLVSAARSAAIIRDFVQKRFALRSVIATEREKESVESEALRAPPPARSAAKPFLYSAESCRSFKKKFEPTRFAKNANSSQLFFARVIFARLRRAINKFIIAK